MTNWISGLYRVLGLAVLGAFLASAQTSAPERDLSLLSKSAVTTSQHEEVAALYRDRAAELSAKAASHEKKAAALEAQPKPPIAHKWPAMTPRPWEKERQLAMQARRAADEASQLSARHTRLATRSEAKSADVD